jgi:hypothetical protein
MYCTKKGLNKLSFCHFLKQTLPIPGKTRIRSAATGRFAGPAAAQSRRRAGPRIAAYALKFKHFQANTKHGF